MTRALQLLAFASLLFGFEWSEQGTSLTDALLNGTPAERRAAVESLAGVPRESAAWEVAFSVPDAELLAIALRHFSRVASNEDAKRLLPLASHSQAEVRAAALSAWERIRPEQSTALLVRAMSDADARVRAQAARSLTGYHDDDAVRALERGIDDPDERVRIASIEALGTIKNPLRLRALRKAAGDSEPKLRAAALRALANGEGSAGLIFQGVQDRDGTVRAAAVAALGNIDDAAAVDLLATIIDQDSAEDARLALEALLYHERPEATGALLQRMDGVIRHGLIEDAANALPHLSEQAQRRWRMELAQALANGSNPSAHAKLLVALGEDEPHDVSIAEQTLLELANRPGDAQLDALRLLGSCHSDRALVTLVRAIGSEDGAIRSVALVGLLDFQTLNPEDKRIADGLLETLQFAPAAVRPAIIERIGATGAHDLAPRLLSLLDSQQNTILLATLKALAKMPHPESPPKLRVLLSHSSAKVRRAAALALGAAGGPRDQAWIESQLDSDRPWDRTALLLALRKIVSRAGPSDNTHDILNSLAFGERESLAALAASTLAQMGRPSDYASLRELLSHRSVIRRTLAAALLAGATDELSAQALQQRVSDTNEAITVRIAADSALAMRASAAERLRGEVPWAVKLAHRCARSFRRPSGKTRARRVIVLPASSNQPLGYALRAVQFADGQTLWMVTDALGQLHLWGTPSGPLHITDPIAEPPLCSEGEKKGRT